jgi:hypothetical protein
MMMRVDDRPRGVDDFFGVLRKPVFARIGIEPALCGGCSAGGHRFRSLLLLFLVIASAAKQSILSLCGAMDCFAEFIIGRAFARPGGSQ